MPLKVKDITNIWGDLTPDGLKKLVTEINELRRLAEARRQANQLLWAGVMKARAELDSMGAVHTVAALDSILALVDKTLVDVEG